MRKSRKSDRFLFHGKLAVLSSLGLIFAVQAQSQIIDGKNISIDEPPPHGEIGLSTSRPYTRTLQSPQVDLRERWFHPGSRLGEHVLTHDQIFYVSDGSADVVIDGVARRLFAGDMAYAFDGSTVALTPNGRELAKVILVWPNASQLAKPAQAYVVNEVPLGRDEPTPHGFIGMTRVFDIFPPNAERGIELRKRVFLPGAKLGRHTIPRDFAYYVVSGEGELTTDDVKTKLNAGIAVYIPRRSEIEVEQHGLAPLELIMIWPAERGISKTPGVFVSERDIASQEPPHGAIGLSTVYRFTQGINERRVEMRKRVLHVGAEMMAHTLPRDQAFLFLGGTGILTINGKSQLIKSEQLAYVPEGSVFGVRQIGAEPLSMMMAWTLPE